MPVLTYRLEDFNLAGHRKTRDIVEVHDGECLAGSVDWLSSTTRVALLVLQNRNSRRLESKEHVSREKMIFNKVRIRGTYGGWILVTSIAIDIIGSFDGEVLHSRKVEREGEGSVCNGVNHL